MQLEASKYSLVHDLFVHTADENYIVARWCAANDLHTDFLWLATHALEKYLKAVLLLNGRSAKDYGHEVVELYEEVSTFAGDLLPTLLVKPERLNIGHWLDRTPLEFLSHIESFGNANNRYLIYGYHTQSEDLHMLDSMAFHIRRLACPLDKPHAPRIMVETNREVLKSSPHLDWYWDLPLDRLKRSDPHSPMRRAAFNLNFAFAPEDFTHESMMGGRAIREPVIQRRIFAPLASQDPIQARQGLEAAEWLLANVRVPSATESRAAQRRRAAAKANGTPLPPLEDDMAEAIKKAIGEAKVHHGMP